MKKLSLFLIAMLIEISALVYIISFSSRIKSDAEKNGSVLVFDCEAHDPYHPFKGRYVHLNFKDRQSKYAETHNKYYLQESYADIVDALSNADFNALEVQLELYVDKKGRAVQKALTVLYNEERIPIEEYCRLQKKS